LSEPLLAPTARALASSDSQTGRPVPILSRVPPTSGHLTVRAGGRHAWHITNINIYSVPLVSAPASSTSTVRSRLRLGSPLDFLVWRRCCLLLQCAAHDRSSTRNGRPGSAVHSSHCRLTCPFSLPGLPFEIENAGKLVGDMKSAGVGRTALEAGVRGAARPAGRAWWGLAVPRWRGTCGECRSPGRARSRSKRPGLRVRSTTPSA